MRTRTTQLYRVGLYIAVALAAPLAGCGGDGTPSNDDAGVTLCTAHVECDDGLFCNGAEQCMPNDSTAGADGCVAGTAPCIADLTCDEAAATCRTNCPNGDVDGDGHNAITCGGDDCDDTDADRFPGNPETCDDGAGGQHDEDCDAATFGTTDRDGDGEVASSCCNAGTSGPNCGTDCDDTTIRRRSGQVEFCDSTDNDCDGQTDEETQDVPWYPDTDGDGFGGAATPTVSCTPVAGASLASTDCDDASAQEHPAQLDICDLNDNNCNTAVDELPICDVVQLIGSAGGTLTATATGGGTIRVQIPAEALGASTPVAVGEIHPRTLPDLAAGERFVGRPVAINPYEQSFGVPASVTLPAAGQNLAVLRLDDEDDTTWELVEATFTTSEALFEANRGGVYVVATKTCTAATEACDSLDNDCDWHVDEEDVCGALCPTDWHVVDGACAPCPIGTTNAAGDDPTGADTSCDVAPCAVNQHVVSGACVPCPNGTMNVAGDDPAGADTACDPITCDDAGAPVRFRLDSLLIPTPQQGSSGVTVGHNVDGVGTVCGVPDYPGGVDNAFIDLAAALPALGPSEPLDLQIEINEGLACSMSGPSCLRLDLVLSVRSGSDCVIVGVEDGEGSALMMPRVGSLDGLGTFEVAGGTFDFSIPIQTAAVQVWADLPLASVTITGTREATAVTDVVIGGWVVEADFETFIMQLLPTLGGIMFEDIAPVLANLYDVQIVGTCSALSAGFRASGSPLVP